MSLSTASFYYNISWFNLPTASTYPVLYHTLSRFSTCRWSVQNWSRFCCKCFF